MTRKRFHKLVMGSGYSRDFAWKITDYARKNNLRIGKHFTEISVGLIVVGMAVNEAIQTARKNLDLAAGGDADDLRRKSTLAAKVSKSIAE